MREHEIGAFTFPVPGSATPSLCWTPDSRYLLFKASDADGADLYAQRIRDGVPDGNSILIKNDVGEISPLQVLRDGRLLFRRGDPPRQPSLSYYLASVDPETGRIVGSPTRVTDTVSGGGDPSPDGRSVAVPASFRGSFVGGWTNLGIVSIEGKVERIIPMTLRGVLPQAWFPDGKSLMVHTAGSMNGIFRVDIATGQTQSLFSVSLANTNTASWGGYVTHFPALSRDGRKIAFLMPIDYETKQTGPRALFVINAEPAAKPPLVWNDPNEVVGWPGWSPDGSFIAFMGRNPKTKTVRILVVLAAGGEVRELARHDNAVAPPVGVEGGLSGGLTWLPNGKCIFYTRVREGDESPSRRKEVWRVSAQGGDKARIVELDSYDARHFRFSRDGRTLFFVGLRNPERPPSQPIGFFTLENFLPKE
ncbi:MAG: hypothetical protein FJ398_17415 [Verrucomicrobia bacterium]|nr:hypothetical protein [Verrucomicrobiota bacterium]